MSIQDRIKKVRLEAGLTQEQFAAAVGIKRANYAQIEIGKQLPTIEVIASIVKKFNKNYAWLIDGKDVEKGVQQKTDKSVHPTVHPIVHPKGNDDGESYTKKVYTQFVDTSGMQVVPITDIKAAAGDGYVNTEPLSENDVLRLPAHMVKSGYHLCIRVKGTSMAPTIQDGGYVIVRLLDRSEWSTMLNDRIYVVVDNEGKTYLKRVKNRFSDDKGFIVLSSDSPDKMSHPSFNLNPDEVMHIWYVAWYFTAKMPNIHDQYYNRLTRVEDNFELIREEVRSLTRKLDSK